MVDQDSGLTKLKVTGSVQVMRLFGGVEARETCQCGGSRDEVTRVKIEKICFRWKKVGSHALRSMHEGMAVWTQNH